ncbi:DUF222 domain-containing protein [Williamsia sp.]|uniref:DUF222 domain-containing protein n=1 Tax=Williamsia sp. TaxID=1872085 RepID=UPI002F93759F
MASGVADLINRIEGMALDAEEVVAVREVLSRRLVEVSLANLSDTETVDLAQAVETRTRRDEAVKVRISAAQASARSKRAERVGQWHTPTGEVTAPVYPHTWLAMRDGAIGVAHYDVIDATLRNLPGTIRGILEVWAQGEQLMAEAARTMDPDELKRVGLYLRDHLDPDGEFDDSDRQHKRELSVSK